MFIFFLPAISVIAAAINKYKAEKKKVDENVSMYSFGALL